MHFKTFPFSRLLLAAVFLTITIVGCDKNDDKQPPTAPVVATAALTNITSSGATAGGSIVSDGGATITASGVVWSNSNSTPTLSDSVATSTSTSGTFTVDVSGIAVNTMYYFRAFATNDVGTSFGEVVTLYTGDTSKVRFTYNGEEVAYGIIISATTGRKWLDRNLGAQRVAQSYDDYEAYGDLFQWGRPDDGHQLFSWTSPTEGLPISGTTTTLATSDVPDHSDFIIYPDNTTTGDWRDDNNSNRWVTNPQGPCPDGWHVPTIDEWLAEVSSSANGTASAGGMRNMIDGYNLLRLTTSGYRDIEGPPVTGVLMKQIGSAGHYWTSSDVEFSDGSATAATDFNVAPAFIEVNAMLKSAALSVRCLKN